MRNVHTRELLKGGSIAMVYRMLNMVLSYLLLLVISRSLGKDGVGVYNLVLAWGAILTLFGGLGLNTSVVRFVSEYNATGKTHLTRQLYFGVLRLTLPCSIAVGFILYLTAPFIVGQFYEDSALLLPFQWMAAGLPFLVLTIVNVEFLRGWKVISISELFRNLSFTVIVLLGCLLLLQQLPSSTLPIVLYCLAGFAGAIITTLVILRKLPARQAETNAEFSILKHLRIAIPMIFTTFVQLINGRIDIIMLGLFHPTALVGVYGVAFKLSMISEFMISALKTIAMPKISEMYWAKDLQSLQHLLKVSTRIIFFSGIPITLVLLIWPEAILNWIGEGFEEGATALRILATAQFIGAASGLVGAFMNMTGNQKIFLGIVSTAAITNIVLNALLIPAYGMEGAAIGTLISTIIWNVGGAIYIWKKHRLATFYHPFQKKQST